MVRKRLFLTILFLFSFLSVFWVVSVDNSFSFDDVGWMQKVRTSTYLELFTFLPHSTYLDRPIGAMFLKLLYENWGLDYCRHHVILVIIHLVNVLLYFRMGENVFNNKWNDKEKSYWGGSFGCVFWGLE